MVDDSEDDEGIVGSGDDNELEWEGIEEMFGDIGMEVVDETAIHGENEDGE